MTKRELLCIMAAMLYPSFAPDPEEESNYWRIEGSLSLADELYAESEQWVDPFGTEG